MKPSPFRKAHWLLRALLCLAAACSAGVDDADGARSDDVVRGARDRGRHPAVVALRADDGTLCSGTLVAPRAVLTARHCVSATTPEFDCPSARPHVLGDRAASSIAVIAAEDALGGAVVARGARLVVPPTRNLCGADVALLMLDRAVRGVEPLGLDVRWSPGAGAAVTVVGYGRRGDSARAGLGVRYARSGVRVLEAGAREFVTGESACNGDSGGPALDARTGLVVGVLSGGTERCTGATATAVWTRASVAAALLDGVR